MSQATPPSEPYVNSNLFSGYYLDNRVDDLDAWDCDEQAREAFDELRELWELEDGLVDSYKEDELLDSWIDEVLEVLGFGTLSETTLPDGGGYNDRLLFESDETRRDAALLKKEGDPEATFGLASAILEAKRWNADFTRRFTEDRSYRDASHQIKYYLERTPERLKWGILTDGRKWRLYGTKDYATETYYEVDLPELLASGNLAAFKYFYVFFRPAAFRETAGTSFLDTVWNESETAAQELGEDLQDNVFTALRVLGEGFLETNGLDIDPDNEEAREELKEQSLVLLYRLMFVLYAESRNLIHPDDPDAEDNYRANFSLDQLRLDIHERIDSGDSFEDYNEFSTSIWNQLQDLFRLVDTGQDALGIPPYNGGLFDDDRHAFLAEHQVSDRYIAEVIYRLGTTETGDGSFVLADYADLDTRHLGSIYEGLLEHEFHVAPEQYAAVAADGGQVWEPATEVSVADAVETVEKGELYVVNDDGERKATGAYYTPDYVVTYIVEETVDPLLEDIDADLRADGLEPSDREYFMRFWQRVQKLKILDPAMGSGHFLTKATGYLTEQVMKVVREQELQSYDEQEFRRDIAKECIYGVDVNGMAVELAKLSMWLETLATDQPLAFLDHHMKSGNSLVGSDITEVLSNGAEENGGQLTLTQAFAQVRERTLEHVMDLMEDLLAIENKNLDDIKSMEAIYEEIRADPLYKRLFEMANVHTAERFGLDVPRDAYEEMAQAIEDESEWEEIRAKDWFYTAQVTASEENFFHWELEFPEVFFGGDGAKREDAGFDVVIGNPPYVRVQNLRQANPSFVEYLNEEENYRTTTGRYDIYAPFVEKGSQLAANSRLGYILPNKFIESGGGGPLREYLTAESVLDAIVDFGQYQIFSGVTTYTCILTLDSNSDVFEYLKLETQPESKNEIRSAESVVIDIGSLSSDSWTLTDARKQTVLTQIESFGDDLDAVSDEVLQGMKSGDNDVLFVEIIAQEENTTIRSRVNDKNYTIENDLIEPIILGKNIHRYEPPETNLGVIYPYLEINEETEIISEKTLQEEYPMTFDYLSEFRERLESRQTEHMRYETWYALNRPRNKRFFESKKVIVPDICNKPEFTIDNVGEYFIGNTGYGVVPSQNDRIVREYLLSVLNSSTTWFYIYHTSTVLENDFRRFLASYLGPLPIPSERPATDRNLSEYEVPESSTAIEDNNRPIALAKLGGEQTEYHKQLSNLNLSLLDHLGSYSDGPTLAKIGFLQPPEGSADSVLNETTEQKPNLRVGEATVVRESPNTVEIRLTARYKPDDEGSETRPAGGSRNAGTGEARGSDHETDQWGYTETEPLPALRITDLTEDEADLVETFVPVAVDEAGGFANFRETATKTNSLIDRLRALTLPRVDDVRDGLADYIETTERAEELEAKIERTDDLIDEIVYELYGLTDEEIEIVEEAVGG